MLSHNWQKKQNLSSLLHHNSSFSYLHDRATVRSGAGTLQVPRQLSGVVQVPSRCPDNCQEWCRYLAGALATAEIGLLSLRLSVSQGASLRNCMLAPACPIENSQGASLGDFMLAPACPIEKVTLWEGFLYLTSGFETDEDVARDKAFARTGNRIRGFGSKAQYAIC